MIEICTVGGYSEVGKNMTAVRIDDDVIILDMGIHLDRYISHKGDEEPHNLSGSELIKIGAAPDDSKISDWKKMVKAIIPTHAHLDHIGAIPYMAYKYNADILCTPFTAEVLESIVADDRRKLKNDIIRLKAGSSFKVTEDIKVEFINMTHSTPQTVTVAIHTKYGTIIYALDFKLDNRPLIGEKPDYKRLKQIGKKGVICLIMDCLYSNEDKKTPSETVAKEMLWDTISGTDTKDKTVIITTFASHIARLRSIVDIAKKMKRTPIFLGRSFTRYVGAAENIGLVNISKKYELVKYGKQIRKALRRIEPDKHRYLIVVTGHQGEPEATLAKMAGDELRFRFDKEDIVIFSCKKIPTTTNLFNREKLEEKLKERGVRIFTDVHVSGHGAKEDHREMLKMLRPKHIIPAHGDIKIVSGINEIAAQMGITDVHIMQDGLRVSLE